MLKIFGREPALVLALLASVLKLGAAFGLHVTGDQQALINATAAALVGLAVAAAAHDSLSAPILGVIQAMVALAVGLGLHWTADQQALVMTAAAALVAMFTRTQVTSLVPAKPLVVRDGDGG
jgi:hypothetical protein